jgi:hypothetical protein
VKKFVVGLAVAGLFLAGAGTAFASSWPNIPLRKTHGAKFYGGEYKFWRAGQHHGSFEWKGQLKDDNRQDGHNVYMQVRIEGYTWKRYNGKQRKTVYLDHHNWSGDQLYTTNAWLRVCRDRGSLHPDNCSKIKHYSRSKHQAGR